MKSLLRQKTNLPSELRKWPKGSSYALDLIENQVSKSFSHNWSKTGGLKIRSTIDRDMQKQLSTFTSRIYEHTQPIKSKAVIQVSAVSLLKNSGEILAIVGGNSHKETQFNRAVGTSRAIGNMVTPLLYAIALEHGYQLNSFTRESDGQEDQQNFYQSIFASSALSTNRLIDRIGHGTLNQHLEKIGIRSRKQATSQKPHEFMRIASPLKLALAYAAIFNGGRLHPARIIHRIARPNSKGPELLRRHPHPLQVLNQASAQIVKLALTDQSNSPVRNLDPTASVPQFSASSPDRQNAWAIVNHGKTVHAMWIGSERGRSQIASTSESLKVTMKKMVLGLSELGSGKQGAQARSETPNLDGIVFGRISLGNGHIRTIPLRGG